MRSSPSSRMCRPATLASTRPAPTRPITTDTKNERERPMSLATSEERSQRAANPALTPRSFILTTSAPDTTGIVAGISGFLASHNALITEAQHYDDPYGNTSFMRTVFHDNGKGMPSMEELNEKFGASVGQQFAGMKWQFHEVQRKCRVLLAVSRQGHCLNSIL